MKLEKELIFFTVNLCSGLFVALVLFGLVLCVVCVYRDADGNRAQSVDSTTVADVTVEMEPPVVAEAIILSDVNRDDVVVAIAYPPLDGKPVAVLPVIQTIFQKQ